MASLYHRVVSLERKYVHNSAATHLAEQKYASKLRSLVGQGKIRQLLPV